MQILEQCLDGLRYGAPKTYLNLTVFPLLTNDAREPAYVTLGVAVAAGDASLREVSEGGSVPELLLENRGARPILILDGEELVGAKQNRIANVTILAAAHATTRLPVSCVEAGRWSYNSDEFAPSNRAQFLDGRRRKTVRVSESLRRHSVRDAEQGEVWAQIDEKAARMRVASETGAMADIYAQHDASIADYVAAFTAAPDQVGAVFAIRHRTEGLELFDCPATFGELLPKLVRSYAIDAIERRPTGMPPSAQAAQAFARRLRQAEIETYPAVGLGTEIRLTAPGVVAAGLVEQERIVHLAGFAAPADENRGAGGGPSGLESFRARRRRWHDAA